jgi:hypothetical protein
MENVQNTPMDQPDVNELQEQCQWLRRQVFTLLVLMVVVSGTLTVYLWRQYRTVHSDLKALRSQYGQGIADYQKNTAPKAEEFVKKLVEYGQTHPDFAPIMNQIQPHPAPAPAPKK